MRPSIVGLVIAVVIGTGVVQAQKSHPEASVTGRWTMAVDSPHGAMEMGLTLSQDGSRVTGTFASPHGDMAVQGTFDEGALKLATTADEGSITFNAKLKDKETLTGYISSSMGDMTFTAKRVVQK
jgi:hypothetical protein